MKKQTSAKILWKYLGKEIHLLQNCKTVNLMGKQTQPHGLNMTKNNLLCTVTHFKETFAYP